MGSKKIEEMPAELGRVRERLEEWRGQRRNGQRIPEELWGAAARAARRHGLNRVSRVLSLDYYHLKKRSGLGKKSVHEQMKASDPVFVELPNPAAEGRIGSAGCVVELEKGNGVRMRICVRDAAAVDWSRMKEAFLGA